MLFDDNTGVALSRLHFATLEKDARRWREPSFSFDTYICHHHHAAGMNSTKWQLTLAFATLIF